MRQVTFEMGTAVTESGDNMVMAVSAVSKRLGQVWGSVRNSGRMLTRSLPAMDLSHLLRSH